MGELIELIKIINDTTFRFGPVSASGIFAVAIAAVILVVILLRTRP